MNIHPPRIQKGDRESSNLVVEFHGVLVVLLLEGVISLVLFLC